ncbi:hypothetical protein ACFXG4_30235 [Nocardia sp. NPDC059246]|uniref:hypothetical protein n=1 Tax=unclassified Nocardia TaxID=2637762 RepID=UPI0036C5462E
MGAYLVAHPGVDKVAWTDRARKVGRSKRTGKVFPFTCGFSLLFLVVTETDISGYVEVSVANARRYHQTTLPVNGPGTFAEVMSRIAYARSVSW